MTAYNHCLPIVHIHKFITTCKHYKMQLLKLHLILCMHTYSLTKFFLYILNAVHILCLYRSNTNLFLCNCFSDFIKVCYKMLMKTKKPIWKLIIFLTKAIFKQLDIFNWDFFFFGMLRFKFMHTIFIALKIILHQWKYVKKIHLCRVSDKCSFS